MTWFDAVVLSVIGLSTLFAAIRGGLREAATLIALAGGGFVAFLAMKPILSATGGDHSFFMTAAVGVALIVIFFLGFYIALHFALRRHALNGRALVIDKTAGGVFGALRGLVLVGLAYLGYGYYLEEASQPEAVRNAVTQPVAAAAAGFFESFAPDSAYVRTRETEPEETDESARDATQAGYARGDRAGLSEMITTVTTSDAGDPVDDPSSKPAEPEDPLAEILVEEEDQP